MYIVIFMYDDNEEYLIYWEVLRNKVAEQIVKVMFEKAGSKSNETYEGSHQKQRLRSTL